MLAQLEEEGLKPSPEADRATLIRRLSLDLTGLPPTLAEVDAFVASRSPRAYEELVDRLLGSAHYGERMAMDWLDAARYADTNGYQNDFARTMWPWRDWVIAAFNRNEPFDQFVVDQIAGDLIPGSSREQKVATGFNRNNRTVTEAGSIDEEWRIENAVDRVETTATVFLGLTMGCARCHDHKYDPITQKEFYQFLGFFSSINEKGVYTEQRGNVPPLVAVPGPEDERELKRLDGGSCRRPTQALGPRPRRLCPRTRRRWEQRAASRAGAGRVARLGRSLRARRRPPLPGPAGRDRSREPGGASSRRPGATAPAARPSGSTAASSPSWRSSAESSLDRTDRFSYGGWIRPDGRRRLPEQDERPGRLPRLRPPDRERQGRGPPRSRLAGRRPQGRHRASRCRSDAWTHVFVTHDGSGKAGGLKVFLNGRPAELEVQNDSLKGSTVTGQPLRLGKRSTSLPFRGDLADLRIYRRTLSPETSASSPAGPCSLALARTPAAARSKAQAEQLASLLQGAGRHSPGARPRSVWRRLASRRRSSRRASRP